MNGQTLEYARPRQPDPNGPVTPRVVAFILAVLSTVPVAFYAVGVAAAPDWGGVLIFAPGCLLTIGYYWRTFATPPLNWRRAIWILSILVQGTWCFAVAWNAYDALQHGNGYAGLWGLVLAAGIWGVPLGLSILALCLEPAALPQ